MKAENILKDFERPGSGFRSVPFWSWNSRLEPEELARQIGEMHDKGVGGFFMHSREGLETEYMSDGWMTAVKAAVAEAKRLGMEAWLYDEDRWPSGTAGGSTAKLIGDGARCKGLTLEVCADRSGAFEDVLALYACEINERELFSLRRISSAEETETGETLLAVRLEVSGKSAWFNNEAPPDNLSFECVRSFLEATHEKYRQVVGDSFGGTVPGIFTDEPSLNDSHASFAKNRGWIPWTRGFGDYFKEKRGYDPLDTIPCLYFNCDKSAKIRHDYWRTVAERYREAYSGQISKWCRKNGLAYTGHFLQEDKLGLSARVNGSIMPHYKYQDVPGVDLLTEQCDEYMTMKQCTSVANQYGKRMVLSEAFGCTGWEFSFEGQKWIGDWQFAMGVNRISKHLALYSLKGCRKRDYPPSFNYNTTWWEHARVVEDYFARIAAVVTPGKAVRDVLVIHQASTAWARLGCSPYGNPVRRFEPDVPAINELGNRYNGLLKYLSGIHYDYDLGDEVLISEDGSAGQGLFTVGEASYRAVVLPETDTLLASTVSLLEAFLESGGYVIVQGALPRMIEGEPSERAAALAGHKNLIFAESCAKLGRVLEDILPRRVSITDYAGREDASILYLLKENEDCRALFIVNNDRSNAHRVSVDLPFAKDRRIFALEPSDGGISELRAVGGKFGVCLAPAETLLCVITADRHANFVTGAQCAAARPKPDFLTSFSPECTVTRKGPNVLTLDMCGSRIGNGMFSPEREVWQAQYELREALGMPQIHHNGIEQRYAWINRPHPNDGTPFALRFRFESLIAAKGCALLMEAPEHWTVCFNGTEIPNEPRGWYLDRDFKQIELPELRVGDNVIELRCLYTNAMEAEDIYILGDFGVDARRRITAENPDIRLGDWTLQGYPHYPGALLYTFNLPGTYTQGKRIFIEPGEYYGVTALLTVNGHNIPFPWKKKPAEITELLTAGENTVAVEVVSSPRNMMGPFHLAEGNPKNTRDASFRPTGAARVSGYNLRPYGLYTPPRIFCEVNVKG